MIEPAALTPRPPRARVALAGAALLAVLTAGVALVARDDGEPEPLALVAGGRSGAQVERLAAPAAADMALFPAGPGFEFRVEGDLSDLGERAAAWEFGMPYLDAAAFSRMARALGLDGEAARRDGGWVLETGDVALTAWPGGDGWSVNFNRLKAGAGGGAPAMSGDEAERLARDLLERMGVLEGQWRAQTFETEVGVGTACARPAVVGKAAETETGAGPDTPVSSEPAPDIAFEPVEDCPAPEPAMKGRAVSFSPILDGRRADWTGWSITLRQDGRVENVFGTWARFERRSEYKLRSVDAALTELRSSGRPGPRPLLAEGAPCLAPGGFEAPPGASALDCGPLKPPVVTITAVELGLLPAPVYEDGREHLHLVPAYRFTGTFEGGDPFETSVIALHPDAIAPPPAQKDGGREPSPLPVEPAPPSLDPGRPSSVDPGAPPGAGSAGRGTGSGEPGFPGPED